jgi:DNA-binding transcriptional MerR regulator
MKMKELERASGVHRETIRFYIREGLLPEPVRSARNVARYDTSFVDQIAAIKELQRARRLPLHVIKAMLDRRAPKPPAADRGAALRAIARELPDARPTPAARLATVAERARLPVAVLHELAAVGAIQILRRRRTEWLDDRSVAIVELWAKLHHEGFTEELGYGPERLAMYVDATDRLARAELRVFTQSIPGRVSQDRSVKMADAGITTMNQILALMRRSALLRLMAEGG